MEALNELNLRLKFVENEQSEAEEKAKVLEQEVLLWFNCHNVANT